MCGMPRHVTDAGGHGLRPGLRRDLSVSPADGSKVAAARAGSLTLRPDEDPLTGANTGPGICGPQRMRRGAGMRGLGRERWAR
ncbi:hypothetical protein DFJ69_4886 [Thermomonospora umbrina]|uniref:Uncharacterized protein n=1 Tax=Thermomonospora umbrina TaxID=111806 RepID=A0A3D9T299_9ACTN|nr:hypothetical protein DFJ69_4886 [Thermomonospora umbrina]